MGEGGQCTTKTSGRLACIEYPQQGGWPVTFIQLGHADEGFLLLPDKCKSVRVRIIYEALTHNLIHGVSWASLPHVIAHAAQDFRQRLISLIILAILHKFVIVGSSRYMA